MDMYNVLSTGKISENTHGGMFIITYLKAFIVEIGLHVTKLIIIMTTQFKKNK